jgi:putative ABC transport system substrate-binding protein
VIDRRTLLVTLAGGILVVPLATGGQQPVKVWRIGFLTASVAEAGNPGIAAFRQRLRELGYVEGQNFTLEIRSAAGRNGFRASRPSL